MDVSSALIQFEDRFYWAKSSSVIQFISITDFICFLELRTILQGELSFWWLFHTTEISETLDKSDISLEVLINPSCFYCVFIFLTYFCWLIKSFEGYDFCSNMLLTWVAWLWWLCYIKPSIYILLICIPHFTQLHYCYAFARLRNKDSLSLSLTTLNVPKFQVRSRSTE